MFKFMICFRPPADLTRFENAYNDFLALVERIPEIQRRQVIHVTGSPQGSPPYGRILELYFASQAAMQQALLSGPGQEAGGELRRFATGSYDIMFAEVYEEPGGHTPAAGPATPLNQPAK
ncbi:MAG: EthD family reductase [Anaerolineae bacterium]|jgi:uncharacterized protein (TIGR02118 family)|nr:EthD family reductase [Anaerolineae bacterium]